MSKRLPARRVARLALSCALLGAAAPDSHRASNGIVHAAGLVSGADPGPPAAAAIAAAHRLTAQLAERRLLIPVAGVSQQQLRDTFDERRGDSRHEAIDIPAQRGTAVMATDDGRVVKLFHSVPGGLTIYQTDRANEVIYYYAHLDAYAEGLREGSTLQRGDVIGYVGSTGNASANAPHLHFAIVQLPPGKEWWKGTAINPFPVLRTGP
ncbi:MAG: M23 family metallopeptidase [Casimicrobiaceae bacterium]